jgi:hypothetical protein
LDFEACGMAAVATAAVPKPTPAIRKKSRRLTRLRTFSGMWFSFAIIPVVDGRKTGLLLKY